jgi:HK97 family phage major capsid protein
MTKIAQLHERKEQIGKRMDALLQILNGAEANGAAARSLTEDELTEVDTLKAELATIERNIQAAQSLESLASKMDLVHKRAKETEDTKIRKRFSVSKALVQARSGKMDGLEAEMHQEGERIARQLNIPTRAGAFLMPDMAYTNVEKRESLTSAPLNVGNMIPTIQHSVEDGYSIRLGLEEIGTTVLRGLTGLNDIPVADLLAEATYTTETAAAPVVNPNVRRPRLTAKQVAAKSKISFLLQATADPALDDIIMRNLLQAEAVCVQKVAIKGGGANQPVGILDSSDTQNKDLAAPGNLDYESIIDLINSPDDENASFNESYAFVTNPKVRGLLQKIRVDAGSGQMVWSRDVKDTLNGYNTLVTNLVPSNGGTGTNESAIIFGNWSQLVMGNWGFRQLIVDDASTDSFTWVKLFSYWDQVILNPKAFAKCRNILTTYVPPA